MSVLPRRDKGPKPAPDARPALERRIQGLANAAFLQGHGAAAASAPAAFSSAPTPAVTPAQTIASVEPALEDARHRAAERLAGLADETAIRTTQAPASAARKAHVTKAAKIGRTLLPELSNTGAKLKERVRPERLKQDRRAFLVWLHANILDNGIEPLFFVPTKGRMALTGLTLRGNHQAAAHDYRPTPYFVFKWALSAIDDDLSRLSFIDYGAGKGRVLLLACQYPFRRIGGIEFAEELHDNAAMNIAQFSRSRMKCRDVDCALEDAVNVKPTDEEAVYYFFNPFAPEVFAEVLAGIVASYHARPRRLYVILIDMDVGALMHATGVFQEAQLPLAVRLQARALSPYKISIYRSLA